MEMYERLRKSRELRGLTQKEVANKLGITHSGYSKYERGERKIDIDRWIELCKILNVPWNIGGYSEEDLYINFNIDFQTRLNNIVKTFIGNKDEMNEKEKQAAKDLFEGTFKEIEDEKRKIVEFIQFDNLEEMIKIFEVEFLYK